MKISQKMITAWDEQYSLTSYNSLKSFPKSAKPQAEI